VIEDSPVLQRLIQIIMRGTGVEVEPFLDGLSGLEAAFTDPPDIVILDLGLPDISGWQVLEQLRAEPSTCEVPVIITTGETEWTVADRAGTLNAVTVTKPFKGAVLRGTILELIASRAVAASPS
jgi:DNA-binding response OmpR family regulator